MGTRSITGWPRKDGLFEGTCLAYDGQPTKLGAEIFNEILILGVRAFRKKLQKAPPASILTDKQALACGCEWAYILATERGHAHLRIYSSYSHGRKMIGAFGHGDLSGTWRLVRSMRVDGAKPRWDRILAEGTADIPEGLEK